MTGIPIYNAAETDFTTNGLGLLLPIECPVEEAAAGMWEATIVQPITDDLRWSLIEPGRIIKIEVPVRESPEYSYDNNWNEETTVSREIYKIDTPSGSRLYLRQEASMDSKSLGAFKEGTEVVRMSVSGDWAKVVVVDGGASGYMWADYLVYVRTENEVVSSTQGSISGVVQVKPSRDQLFRIYSVEKDTDAHTVTAKAMHIFYDFRGNLIDDDYAPENVEGAQVVANIKSKLLNDGEITLHGESISGKVTADYGYMNPVEALLDPDIGVVRQTGAMLIRDNFDAYLLPDTERDTGVTIRRGKNLIGVRVTYDDSSVITRVIPQGWDKDGKRLYLSGTRYIDSPYINDYPTPRSKRIEYDVVSGSEEFEDDAAARAELKRLAQLEFSQNHIDLPNYGMEVDFVLLGNTLEYKDYAALQAVHMYDAVTVIDELIGLTAKVRMTKGTWNPLTKQYDGITLGNLSALNQMIYSYNLPDGGISGGKIMPGSTNGNVLRDQTIGYAKIGTAAITQLSADALQAVSAYIGELAAGNITTDQLYADLATIAAAQITAANIEKANIDWANIDTLNANIAGIALAKIQTADIDYAKIKDLVTDTAIITEGVGGQLYIARLAVTEANMVQLTVGSLMLKAEDGSFVRLVADGSGGVTTETVAVEGENIADATISGTNLIENTITARELNVAKIFADEALIGAIKAANIDVANLFAAQATVDQLDSWVVSANTIEALQGALDLWASEKINIAVGEIDTSTAENVQNSSVTITPEMVQILTSLFSVQNEETGMILDENGLSAEHVSAPNLQEKYTGPSSVTVGTGGDYGSMTSFASEISGKYIAEDISVTVVSDLTGEATFRHVSGAEISIIGGGYSMLAPLNVENCTSRVSISNMTFSYSGGVYSKYIGSRVYLLNCLFNISSTLRSGRAIDLDQGALLYASNSQFYNTLGRLISMNELSRCILEWCAGAPSTGSSAFQVLTGSDLRSLGSYPSGSVTTDASATYTLNGTADSGTAQGTASSLTTQEFTCTNSDTCRGSSNWDGSGYIWQGYTTSGIHRGYLWFDGLAAAISGKTIKSATLKLKRVKGIGREASAVLKAYYSLKTTNSGSATVQTGYGGELGGIRMGEEKVLDLPVEILTRMQTYGYGGICLYTAETSNASGKNYSSNYCKLYGADSDYAPVLTVTYQ